MTKGRAKQKQTAFTIVELLIVIVVISILAAIALVAYNGIQERARVAKANSELKTLERAIRTGRVSQDKILSDITGDACTRCHGTQAAYEATLDKISAASGANLSALKDGDPWGNMYFIDENEGEGGCVYKDHIYVSPSRPGVLDINVPYYRCPG